MLTQAGADQHYSLGHDFIRQKYIFEHETFSPDYVQNELFIQTTDKDRTKQSALSQLQGIFEHELSFPEMDDTFDYFFLPIPDDRFLHVTGDSCPRME